jgi:hypothetical protein
MLKRLLMVGALASASMCLSQDAKPSVPPQNPQPKAIDSNTPAVNAPTQWSSWWSDSNWWLVIVATGTAGFIGWQSWETRKAAVAGTKAAQAALVSAQATVNLERPWIFVRAESYGYQRFKFIAENRGRSPADIVGFADEWLVVDDVLKWFDSGVPDYHLRTVSPHHLLLAGEGGFQCGACNVGDIKSMRKDVDQINSGELLFIMYGKVVYYDVLNRTEPPHETRFCFTWNCREKLGNESVDGSDSPAAFSGYL